MKKIICVLLLVLSLCAFSACAGEKENVNNNSTDKTGQSSAVSQARQTEKVPEKSSAEADQSSAGIDVDLTKLSSTMVYSEVYNMMNTSDNYIGKTVKMNGQFSYYEDPNSKAQYFACIIADATACCSQGLEFTLTGEHTYPEDYPELGSEITVTGTFETYEEDGNRYCRLANATFA